MKGILLSYKLKTMETIVAIFVGFSFFAFFIQLAGNNNIFWHLDTFFDAIWQLSVLLSWEMNFLPNI